MKKNKEHVAVILHYYVFQFRINAQSPLFKFFIEMQLLMIVMLNIMMAFQILITLFLSPETTSNLHSAILELVKAQESALIVIRTTTMIIIYLNILLKLIMSIASK